MKTYDNGSYRVLIDVNSELDWSEIGIALNVSISNRSFIYNKSPVEVFLCFSGPYNVAENICEALNFLSIFVCLR